MKKLLGTSFIAISFLFLIQAAAVAQTHSNTKVGVGILYGDEPEAVGLQITGTYRINQHVEFAPDVSIYFPSGNNTIYHSYWAINFNGHYIFVNNTNFDIYALAGLNITTVKEIIPIENYNEEHQHHTKLGINLGLGSEYHFQHFSLYGELKYIVSDLGQVVIGVGARVPIPSGSK
jgi:opacity protein-like surface antigen